MCVYIFILVFICMPGYALFVVSWRCILQSRFLAVVSFSSEVLNSHDALIIVSAAPVCTIDSYFFPAVAMFILPFAMSKGFHACLKSCWIYNLASHTFPFLYSLASSQWKSSFSQIIRFFFSTLAVLPAKSLACFLSGTVGLNFSPWHKLTAERKIMLG